MEKQEFIKIHSPSPYESLDSETDEWLKAIKMIWSNWRSTKNFSDMLFKFFSTSEEPFKSALSMAVCSGDFYSGKNKTLAFEIILSFSQWLQTQSDLEIPKSIKLDAVSHAMRQRSSDLLKLVVHTFKAKEDKEIFLDEVNDLIKRKKFKEACQLASLIELHEHFGIQEFLVPLIFQDKYCNVEMFLNNSQRHQHELAVFLDDLIGKRDVTTECLFMAENLGVTDAKLTFMRYKALSKLLMKLVRNYQLSPMTCPNMNRRKGKGIVYFILHKKYIEKSISEDSWTEMILEAIGDDQDLHEELVQKMVLYRDLRGALAWAERLGVSKEVWPQGLLDFSEKGEETIDEPQDEICRETWNTFEEPNPAEPEKFHKFPLDESQIKVIDTLRGFSDFLADITTRASIIGIDAEWKPSFGVHQSVLSLIQVAAYHRVYILDMITLGPIVPQSMWARFASFLFEESDVMKIGFDTRTDLTLIKETFRKLHSLKKGSEVGFLDLAILWQTLVRKYKFEFPFPTVPDNAANLSRLIQLCLGEPLDKSDQFSNWENRPLRKSQVLYAAIDAYCLLEVYEVIMKEAKCQRIPISEVVEAIMYGGPVKKAKKKGGRHNNSSPRK